MAITLTVQQLAAALRLGDSAEETAEATRLLAFASVAVERHLGAAFATTPEAVVNESVVRCCGYLYDMPNAGRGAGHADVLRNSGVLALLLPWRVHRAGSTSAAVAMANEAVGTPGNPVTNVAISGGNLVVTFDDGTTRDDPLPAGMTGGGADRTARDAAAAAQSTADGAASAAVNAQAEINAHEASTHNTDGTARTAASAAQARADDAFALADEKVDTTGAASAAREVVVDWAEDENPEPIPAPKLVNVVNAHLDIVNVLGGRLPGLPIVMRLGWSQTRTFTELDFDRPLPPIGGSISGMSGGLAAPPFPPAIASDPTLFLGIWLAGDPDVAELPAGFAVADKSAITVDGAAGVYFASTERLPASVAGDVFKVFLVGDRIVTESDLAAHASDPDAHHVPPTGMGGGPAVLYEASTAAIGTASGLIAGNVACPETGALEFYFEARDRHSPGRRRIRPDSGGKDSGCCVCAERYLQQRQLRTCWQSRTAQTAALESRCKRTTNYLMLSAQAPGDFFIRVAHTG